MIIAVIAAVADNGVIGSQGVLPWHLADDLANFRRLTTGHHVIVGRATWDTFPHPLPERSVIVVSRRLHNHPRHALLARNLDEALTLVAQNDDEVFVAGGQELFREALPRAHRLYLTRVHASIVGDRFFPWFPEDRWQLTWSRDHEADERNSHPYSFQTWEVVTS